MGGVFILGNVFSFALRRQKGCPGREIEIAGDQIAIAARDRHARPPYTFRKRHRLARQHETALRERDGLDGDRRRLVFRLTRERIGERCDQRPYPSRCGIFLAPVDRREQHAALLTLTDDNFQNALTEIGREPRVASVDNVRLRGINRMNLDVRFGQMLAEARTKTGTRHGVPLVADASGVEPQWARRGGFPAKHRHVGGDEVSFAIRREISALGEETRLRFCRALCDRPHE